MSWLNVPNAISLMRLALVPVFVWLWLTREPEWALTVFVVAAVSDLVDGFLARVLNQRSKFGGLIDPLADKLLVFSALVLLVASGLLPLWLLLLEAIRDAAMAVGAVLVRRRELEIPTTPSRIGKYSTFALALTVAVALASGSRYTPEALAGYVMAFAYVSGLCVVVSTLQYWARFGYLLWARTAPGRN